MKILNKKIYMVACATLIISVTSCKKLLNEEPRSEFYPSYFTTPGGVKAGITGVYNDLRGVYTNEGQIYYYAGTDEMIAGGSSSSGGVTLNNYNGITSSLGIAPFGSLFTDINTLNGVIQLAQTASLDDATKKEYIAHAKFLRAWIYFLLVQTYGGTTATQKSGIPLHTAFLTEASSSDAPSPLVDIYKQIIKDLSEAATDLPAVINSSNKIATAGKIATSAVAKAYLAKVYLTRGYLKEVAEPTDFKNAADITAELITNKATYGLDLFQDYNDAVSQANDYGKETMFAIDFGFNDPTYSNYVGNPSGGTGFNYFPVLFRWNYVTAAGVDNSAGIDAIPQKINTSKQPLVRDVYNGRPYVRLAPNAPYTVEVAFADQIHDNRWDATFQTFWICNKAGVPAGVTSTGTSKGALVPTTVSASTSYQPPINGDTAILMPATDVTMTRRDAFKGLIVAPKQYTNNVFPVVKKFDDRLRTGMNDFSSRPVVLLRFSEVYLVNAEANYMLGMINAAVTSLNVIRQRAAYRKPEDGLYIPKSQTSVNSTNMGAINASNAAFMALTPDQISLLGIPNNTTTTTKCGMDLILDEYTRELYADPRRWFDLVRTQQLVRRVKMYNAAGAPNIQDYHTRRPIPQTQINAVVSGPVYPQNNGY